MSLKIYVIHELCQNDNMISPCDIFVFLIRFVATAHLRVLSSVHIEGDPDSAQNVPYANIGLRAGIGIQIEYWLDTKIHSSLRPRQLM